MFEGWSEHAIGCRAGAQRQFFRGFFGAYWFVPLERDKRVSSWVTRFVRVAGHHGVAAGH